MSNPTEMRVYYDEDISGMSEDEIESQLNQDINEVEGIISAEVTQVFTSRPYEAIVRVNFDGMETSGPEVQQEVSLFDFLDKAIIN